MFKLVENELIKIFKRKHIYFLWLISIIAIIIYNLVNPDQNLIRKIDTKNINISSLENTLNNITDNKEYINQKASIAFWKLFNKYEVNSWQRYALKEESSKNTITNVPTNSNLDIDNLLITICSYENNYSKDISSIDYENAKVKYNKYIEALDSNNWKNFVLQKIDNLKEKKDNSSLSSTEIDEINFQIELYNLRLNNDICYDDNIKNQYIERYKQNYYGLLNCQTNTPKESQAYIQHTINEYTKNMNICQYAINNNLNTDISNEYNIIYNNEIDARISFIRTLKHFDLIIIIITIYISTTIISNELNTKTFKKILSKPIKRTNIIISKIITSLLLTILSILIIVIAQYIIGGFIFGFESYKLDYIGYSFKTNKIIELDLFKYIGLISISKLPMYLIISVFCIFISNINNNQAMSMIITLAIFILGNYLISEWSKVESLSIITRYFITNNWDFSLYLFGQTSPISGITFIKSIIIYFIHFILLFKILIYKFNQKEIYDI